MKKSVRSVPKLINPLKDRFLASVVRHTENVATLKVLYVWKDGKWETYDDLPNVVWHSVPPSVLVGRLWIIRLVCDETVSHQSKNEDEEAIMAYQVATLESNKPESVVEVFFERPQKQTSNPKRSPVSMTRFSESQSVIDGIFTDLEETRLLYFTVGRKLDFTPQERVYIGVRDQFVIGPLTLQQDAETKNWKPSVLNVSRVAILDKLTSTNYQTVEINGVSRNVIVQNQTPRPLINAADLRDDEEFLKTCLSDLPEVSLLKNKADEILEQIKNNPLLRTLHQKKRLEFLINQSFNNAEAKKNMSNWLMQIPSVKLLLKNEIEVVCADARKNLEDELSKVVEQAKILKDEIDKLEAKRSSMKQESALIEAKLAHLRTERTEEDEKRIALIAASVMRSAVHIHSTEESIKGPRSLDNIPLSQHFICSSPRNPLSVLPDASEASENDALRGLKRHLEQEGIESDVAFAFLGAIIMGITPVVVGPASSVFIQEVGQVLFGGYTIQRNITSFMTECADLFGKVHIPSGTFRPDADGLTDLIMTADHSKLHLSVFDGFNRCDIDAVFSPLLSSRTLPIMRSSSVRTDDPYFDMASKPWPTNFISVMRYTSDGMRPSPRFWAQSVTVIAAFSKSKEMPLESKPTKPMFLTEAYVAELKKKSFSYRDKASEILEETKIVPIIKHLNFLGTDPIGHLSALLSLGLPEEKAIEVVVQSLVGLSISSDILSDEIGQHLQICQKALEYA